MGNPFKSKKRDVTTTTVQEPSEFIQPSLQRLIDTAENIATDAPSIVPGFNPLQQEGFQGILDRARGGDQLLGAGQSNILNTLQGGFLGGQEGSILDRLSGSLFDPSNNPFAGLQKRLTDAATAATNTAFGGAGRSGSGLNQLLLARGVGDAVAGLAPLEAQFFQQNRANQLAAAGLETQQFEQERGRQLEATRLLPSLDILGFNAPQRIGSVGDAFQNLEREQRLEPFTRAEFLNSIISPNATFNQSTTQPFFTNPAASITGGLTAAGSLFNK